MSLNVASSRPGMLVAVVGTAGRVVVVLEAMVEGQEGERAARGWLVCSGLEHSCEAPAGIS
jgi:predicted benzoate:H+ symporter BenE